jgi:hypothetical protein
MWRQTQASPPTRLARAMHRSEGWRTTRVLGVEEDVHGKVVAVLVLLMGAYHEAA